MKRRIWTRLFLGVAALAVLGVSGLWVLGKVMPKLQPGVRDFSALIWAARTGQDDAIAHLVRSGMDPNRRDEGPNHWTPMLHAVHKGQLVSVRALLAAGADVNLPAPNGLTPLALAAAQGEPEIVDELLAAGADPRARGASGWSVIQQAVGSGNYRVVQSLLRKDPGLGIGHGPRAWMVRGFARLGGHGDTLRLLDRLEAHREASR